ncbi:uncharacterized protein BP01DRAFT_378556 [Aspergillus saccharolyticus JOP 1030-1]|uniref:Uncharacterized protein n=1 Tax=Aspergillus saccharolyticus JOP 1030-1 TaxID=1450539 RepID=A0A318ZR04_9EURO|nr:hypothetical protein BP01DRAFT_378556 [Aspergillus saccharolyticus JOP 1030-1]PYH49946.1 hypothetical protein BP01DRAFT_378556 [Aspergillus saccharolyticus JOP 1030-1]
MVNWKAPESTDRLIASLIVAHPGLKLDYRAMAIAFGQGASYDSIEGRFRRWRKMADELRGEVEARGISLTEFRGRNSLSGSSTPRTPRGPRNGVSKAGQSASSSRKDGRTVSTQKTPTRPMNNGSRASAIRGESLVQAIFVEDGSEEEQFKFKRESNEVVVHSGLATPVAESKDVIIVDSPVGGSALAAPRQLNPRLEKNARKTIVPDLPSISAGFEAGLPSSAGVGLSYLNYHTMDDMSQHLHGNLIGFDHLMDKVSSGSYIGGDVI